MYNSFLECVQSAFFIYIVITVFVTHPFSTQINTSTFLETVAIFLHFKCNHNFHVCLYSQQQLLCQKYIQIVSEQHYFGYCTPSDTHADS